MTKDETLREIERRIAENLGWTGPWGDDFGNLTGYEGGEERCVPQWARSWYYAGQLVAEMEKAARTIGGWCEWTSNFRHLFLMREVEQCNTGEGDSFAEAAARCWCAWKNVDLSDLP